MKKLGLGNQCLLALVAGITFGHFASNDLLAFITPFGEAFLKLLRLVIVPLTFSTIVASFSKLGHISYVKKLGISTLFWFLLTAIIASSIGVGVGFILAPGNGLYISNSAASSYMPRDIPSISSTLLNMVPGNLIGEISEGKVIPVIIFALFFGIALTSLYENGQNLRVFFDEFSQTMFKITRVIIRLSPIGIFALTAKVGHD